MSERTDRSVEMWISWSALLQGDMEKAYFSALEHHSTQIPINQSDAKDPLNNLED